jgi:C4-dicarboxylate transporter DctM subunit
MFIQLDSFSLLALPYFILAGGLMERGGISDRLFRFANAVTRPLRGGLAQATMGASIVMAGLTGSGVADISAIGSIAAPSMLRKGYRPGFVTAVLTAGGALGPIFPPSILMIIYGSITGMSIAALFVAGILPGLLMALAFMSLIWILAGQQGYAGEQRASLREVAGSFREAAGALIAPIIILGGIVSGVFTATEAGAVAVAYAFLISTFVYRTLRPRDYFPILISTARTTGMVLLIIATAGIFSWLLARLQFPELAVAAMTSISPNPLVILPIIIIFLLVVGTVVEVLPAAIILIPVLDPIGAQLGLSPLHYAFVIVLALNIGSVMPPVGVYLCLANTIARARLADSVRQVVPFIAIMLGVTLLVAYVPELALFLPRIFLPQAVTP